MWCWLRLVSIQHWPIRAQYCDHWPIRAQYSGQHPTLAMLSFTTNHLVTAQRWGFTWHYAARAGIVSRLGYLQLQERINRHHHTNTDWQTKLGSARKHGFIGCSIRSSQNCYQVWIVSHNTGPETAHYDVTAHSAITLYHSSLWYDHCSSLSMLSTLQHCSMVTCRDLQHCDTCPAGLPTGSRLRAVMTCVQQCSVLSRHCSVPAWPLHGCTVSGRTGIQHYSWVF